MADLMRAVYKKYVNKDDEEGIKDLATLGEMPVYKKL
jgi:formylmethanofuran dehydrogenase subunit D